jgi:hypothetical protein
VPDAALTVQDVSSQIVSAAVPPTAALSPRLQTVAAIDAVNERPAPAGTVTKSAAEAAGMAKKQAAAQAEGKVPKQAAPPVVTA